MKEDGRLQHYIDSLAEEVETSILSEEMQEVFEGETVIRAQITRYALDTDSICDVINEATYHFDWMKWETSCA